MVTVAAPLRLPCGQVLPNRLSKSALTEGLADEFNRATEEHCRLYRAWSEGGTGLLITGNIQVDRRYLERPGNVAIDGEQDAEALRRLCAYAQAAHAKPGSKCWVQLGHAGRQCDPLVNTTGVGPSSEPWKHPAMGKVTPKALTLEEVYDVKRRFVHAARICKDCGFSGVQLHSAHGYLFSSFLNPRANSRNDQYGGSLENRARLLLETVAAVREVVGKDFPLGVKINSADFQQGGFTTEECVQVAMWLESAGIDLIELSGGNYENPALLVGGDVFDTMNRSTVLREAYFMEFAREVRRAMKVTPIMVTGGVRSKATMNLALANQDCDLLGIGRPLCGMPDASAKLLNDEISELPRWEVALKLPLPLLPLMFTPLGPKLRMGAQQMWYYQQERNLGSGRPVDLSLGLFTALVKVLRADSQQAAKLQGMQCVGLQTNAPSKASVKLLFLACIALAGGVVLRRLARERSRL